MKQHRIGNLLEEVKTGIICQQVNAQGVMGAGFAKAVRAKWPQVWDRYFSSVGPFVQRGDDRLLLGTIVAVEVSSDLVVCNIIGQQFYGNDGKRYTSYDALTDGFQQVADIAICNGLDVHYPLIGCGLGGGDWSIVSAIIDAKLDKIDHTLWTLPPR